MDSVSFFCFLSIYLKTKKDMKRIRLTESDLHRIVKESVMRIMETSDEKLARAMQGARAKRLRAANGKGTDSNAYLAAKDQEDYFNKEFKRRYDSGNVRRKARLDKASEDAYKERMKRNDK